MVGLLEQFLTWGEYHKFVTGNSEGDSMIRDQSYIVTLRNKGPRGSPSEVGSGSFICFS